MLVLLTETCHYPRRASARDYTVSVKIFFLENFRCHFLSTLFIHAKEPQYRIFTINSGRLKSSYVDYSRLFSLNLLPIYSDSALTLFRRLNVGLNKCTSICPSLDNAV